MKVAKIIWKFIVGGVVTGGGWLLVARELGATTPTVATVIGIGLIAVGVSVLAGILD